MKKNFKANIIFLRYLSISLLILFFLSEFFTNIMIYLLTKISYYFLATFNEITLTHNLQLIFNNGNIFLIIKECIAISAYILISLIFLSIPIHPKDTYKIILKSYLIFTIFNIIRIFILMTIQIKLGQESFEIVHLAFYEFISGIGVAIIVIYYLKKHKIKKIFPFFTDINFLIKNIKRK